MAVTRSNRLTGLGELQLQVLDVLSHLGEATVYQVLDQFPARKRPRYTTVLTVLRTLEEKGLAGHRVEERSHVYRLTVKPREIRRRVLREVLDRAFGGSPRELMLALLDDSAVTPEVLAELRKLLAESEVRDERS
jgi:predicted transcriptional regulator